MANYKFKNYDVNATDHQFEADYIQFSNLQFEDVKANIDEAVSYYGMLTQLVAELESIDALHLTGDSVEYIKFMLEVIPKYVKDFDETIKSYESAIKDTISFTNELPNCKILKEIEGIDV